MENNLILKMGPVDKRKVCGLCFLCCVVAPAWAAPPPDARALFQGLFARRRQLLLTEGPHLYYVDPVNKVLKGEIPWSPELRPEAKNFKTFFVHTVGAAQRLHPPPPSSPPANEDFSEFF